MRALALAVWLCLAAADLAGAAGWGAITPGETTRREVEARYGRPSRERAVTEGDVTAAEWTYSGDRAPQGLERMVVGFGLARPQGFAPEIVRSLTLYPKPRLFTALELMAGWGKPDAIGSEEQTGRLMMRYDARAILIVLDKSGQWAETIVFAPENADAKR
jgi:hypothetical protein